MKPWRHTKASVGPKAAKRLLSPKGEYLLLSTQGKIWKFPQANITQVWPGKRTWAFLVHPDGSRLEKLVALFEGGKLRIIVVSRYPLEHAADALKEGIEGHATGKIIVEN